MGNAEYHHGFEEAHLRPQEAAAWLGCVTKRTLDNWRWQRRGPRYVKVGGRVVYRRSDLETFMAACAVEIRQK
jgi:predicted DNA-binding transcriptional regulator AlpA